MRLGFQQAAPAHAELQPHGGDTYVRGGTCVSDQPRRRARRPMVAMPRLAGSTWSGSESGSGAGRPGSHLSPMTMWQPPSRTRALRATASTTTASRSSSATWGAVRAG